MIEEENMKKCVEKDEITTLILEIDRDIVTMIKEIVGYIETKFDPFSAKVLMAILSSTLANEVSACMTTGGSKEDALALIRLEIESTMDLLNKIEKSK